MILNALSDTPLPVYGDGKNVRDWIHVEDYLLGRRDDPRQGDRGSSTTSATAQSACIEHRARHPAAPSGNPGVADLATSPTGLVTTVGTRSMIRKIERELGWRREALARAKGSEVDRRLVPEPRAVVEGGQVGRVPELVRAQLRGARNTVNVVVLGAGGLLGRHMVEELRPRAGPSGRRSIARRATSPSLRATRK